MTRLILGLTGGIGSGKSTVASLLEKQGATLIDTDQVAREVVAPGTACLAQIILHFGRHIVTANGHLNRAKLRQIISNSAAERQWLEGLLHPVIRHAVVAQLRCHNGVIVVMIPLLRQRHTYPLDIVWTVETTPQQQRERVIARDHCHPADAQALMAAQPSAEERRAFSDVVIHNHGTLTDLEQQVLRRWQQLPRI